ncbi:MAG: aspartate/glutamate racemase family protein [Rhodobacteraceae bacterium]|nr:aspartate/glutamate racemase family protein [Paracoccaceae bacterium]
MATRLRILAVNPNTSQEVTEAYLREVRRIAPKGVTIDGVTGKFGARIVSTKAENTIAGHAMLDLIAEHGAGYDGVILAISFDTALRSAQEVLTVPVVGVTQAALAAAGAQSADLGVVVFGDSSLPMYQHVIDGYGVHPVGYENVCLGSAEAYLAPQALDQEVVAACRRLASAGAGAVVICGTVIVGMAARLQAEAGVPLFDGASALALCLDRIRAGDSGPVRPIPLGGTTGLSPELTALLRGDGRSDSG